MADHDRTTLGFSRSGERLLVRPRDLTGRHTLVLGQSGSGKSAFVTGLVAESLVRDPEVRVTLLDAKHDTMASFRDVILPALADGGRTNLGETCTVEPWGPFVPPFNLCAPMDGVTSDVQANFVVAAIEKWVGDEFGVRGRPIAVGAARAAIELRGNLLTLTSLLSDQSYREAAAALCPDPAARHFLTEVLPRERQDSVGSVLARIRSMTAIDRMRAILAAPTSVRGTDLISGEFVGIDAGYSPLGEEKLATGFGSWAYRLASNAVMARPTGAPPLLLVIEEFQRLIDSEEEFLRLLEQSRAKNAALTLVTQGLESLPAKLRASVLLNCRNVVAMSPNADTLRGLDEYLPRPTGRRVDPLQPDRLLTPAAERDAILSEFADLPARHGVYVDTGNRARMLAFRARSFPFEELARRAERVDAPTKDRIARGRLAVPYTKLLAGAHDPVKARMGGGLFTPPGTIPPPPTTDLPPRKKRRLDPSS